MDYKPLGSRVLVKVLTRSEIEVGGITLALARGVNKYGKAPKETDEQILRCEVLKKGDSALDVEIGDVVIIAGYAGRWLDADLVDGPQTHRIVDEADILAIDLEQTEKLKQPEVAHA